MRAVSGILDVSEDGLLIVLLPLIPFCPYHDVVFVLIVVVAVVLIAVRILFIVARCASGVPFIC